jgi:F-type H+-transporting ATPase subunit a
MKRTSGHRFQMRPAGWAVAAIIVVALLLNALLPRPPKPQILLHGEILSLFGLHVPNTLLASWLSILLLVAISFVATRRMSLVPGRLQAAVEWVVESLYNLVARSLGDRTRRVFPVVVTLFLFILMSNWMELLPGFGSVGLWPSGPGEGELVPFLRSADTDLNTTIALAVFAVGSIQVFGAQALGLSAYLSRFLDLKKLFGKGSLIERIAGLFIGLLEVFDQLTKIVSFSFRLFGNIFAGEVLISVIAFLMPVLGPLPFMALELFVGFIQALIFALLTVAFASAAMGHGTSKPSGMGDSQPATTRSTEMGR